MSAQSTISFRDTSEQPFRHRSHGRETEEDPGSISSGNVTTFSDAGLLDSSVLEDGKHHNSAHKIEPSPSRLKKDSSRHRETVQEASVKRDRKRSRSLGSKHKPDKSDKSKTTRSRSRGFFKSISGFLSGSGHSEVEPKRSTSRKQSQHRKASPTKSKHQYKEGRSTEREGEHYKSSSKSNQSRKHRAKERSSSRKDKMGNRPEETSLTAAKGSISFQIPRDGRTASLTSVASQTVRSTSPLNEPKESHTDRQAPPRSSTNIPESQIVPQLGGQASSSDGYQPPLESGSWEWQWRQSPPPESPSPPPPPPQPPTTPVNHTSQGGLNVRGLWSTISSLLNPIPRSASTIHKSTQTEPILLHPRSQAMPTSSSRTLVPENSQNVVSQGPQPQTATLPQHPTESQHILQQERIHVQLESQPSRTLSKGTHR